MTAPQKHLLNAAFDLRCQDRVRPLSNPQRAVHEAEEEDAGAAEVASSMRAVAPPIQSFAMGRRR